MMGASVSTREGSANVDTRFSSLLPYYLRDVEDKKRSLGSGSYATVKVVEVKGKKCAAKQLHAVLFEYATQKQAEEMLLHFANECKLLQRVKHPNIVEFLGVCHEKDSHLPRLVMELLDSTLSDYLEKHGVPDASTYYSILSDVALGLRYLHEQSPPIIHRDLSANNVLLSPFLQAKISDLGVAKILNLTPGQMSRMTKAPGTPVYMPPEALTEAPIYNTAIDIFSFGVLMIHTLSAEWPIPSEPTKLDPQNPSRLLAVTEFDRRKKYLDKIGHNHPLMQLIQGCLHNNYNNRPDMSTVLRKVTDAQISYTSCCDCLACCSHDAQVPHELSLVLGEEVTVLRKMEGKWVKATSQRTHNTGYVPPQCLQEEHHLPLVVGLQDYSNDSEQSLCFNTGDHMLIINNDEEEMWFGYHKETRKTGHLPRAFVREKLERKRWYMGNMVHDTADVLLKQKPNTTGSFLIHDQSHNVRCLALRGEESIVHYQIYSSVFAVCVVAEKKFKTLQELLGHYSQEKGSLSNQLKQPCSSCFGPLQRLAFHNVSEKLVISNGSFGVKKEFEICGKTCAGIQLLENLLALTEEEQHEMLLQLADDLQQLQRTQHPNIEQFYGVHVPQDCQLPYLVMELFHLTLSDHLKKHGVPDSLTSYSILSDVALGLRYLHQQSPPITHGDVSGNSVLLSSSLQAKISDPRLPNVLRISSAIWSEMTQRGNPGIPCYMPPDVLMGSSKCSTVTDCFSFGVLMIHTLCGDWPSPDDSTCVHSDVVLPVSEFDRRKRYIDTIGLNHPLMDLIRRCLSTDSRPDMCTVVTEIADIQFQKNGGKVYYPQVSYKSSEMTMSVGDDVRVYGASHDNELLKVFLVDHHKLGYVPREMLRQLNQCPIAVALYDYHGDAENSLKLTKGDIVHILSTEGEIWWYVYTMSSRKQGFIPDTCILEHRESYKWYWGNLSHSEADSILSDIHNDCGTFLIHEVRQDICCLSLRGQDSVMHYQIQRSEGTLYIVKEVSFKTLHGLVHYYSQHAGVLCCKLEQPYHVARGTDEVDRSDITLLDRVMVGQFGDVWKGLKGKTYVAVKTLTSGTISAGDFLRQASLIAELNHPHVIQGQGICTKEKPLYILVEFMEYGSLQEYLSKGEGKEVHFLDLVHMALQVASGMAYLEQQHIIHCGLAARNILVGKDKVCKISNFKRAQRVDVYKLPFGMQVPIKWTAPEVLTTSEFTIKSDVWSFGVVLYEIVTRGQRPYSDMNNNETCKAVQSGYHMPQPAGCPQDLYNMMLKCWESDPISRPRFEAIGWQLEEMFVNKCFEDRTYIAQFPIKKSLTL